MKWKRICNDDGFCRLAIEAEWSEIAGDYEDIATGYARVCLPGFRPGKVPRSVIKKRFQKEIVDDLAHRTALRFGREVVREAGIEALGPIEAEKIVCEKDKPLRFQVRFHPMPEIDLPEIGNLKIVTGSADPRDQVSRKLLELVPFEVPNELISDELVRDDINDCEQGGAEWEAARDRIRLMLILKKIASQEGIEVDEEDVNRRIDDKAKEFGTSTEALRSELEEGKGIARLREMLIAESTLDYLIDKVRGTSSECP